MSFKKGSDNKSQISSPLREHTISRTPSQESQNTTQATTRLTRKRRRTIRRPQVNSIYDLMHENAGSSLFIRPSCWTAEHSKLLGAKFTELPPCDAPQPKDYPGSTPSLGELRRNATIHSLNTDLNDILEAEHKHYMYGLSAVRNVLRTLWPATFPVATFLPELNLCFGDRIYRDSVRTQLMWDYLPDIGSPTLSDESSFRSLTTQPAESFLPSVESSAGYTAVGKPILCYLSKKQLACSRENMYRVSIGPNKTKNEPVWRLQQLRSKMLVPADPNQDPVFIGIFLAMAQRHFYQQPPSAASRRPATWSPRIDKSKPEFRDLKLRFLTYDSEPAQFLVYTGYITKAFLERFHDPCKAPPLNEADEVPGIRIEYTKVPIWPILGLKERMGKAFGEDLVGSFNSDSIWTWSEKDSESESEEVPSAKRKREALSEVLNGSFSESDDEPVLSAKKRCLKEGTPVGVVV